MWAFRKTTKQYAHNNSRIRTVMMSMVRMMVMAMMMLIMVS